jgi:hypothetical protein
MLYRLANDSWEILNVLLILWVIINSPSHTWAALMPLNLLSNLALSQNFTIRFQRLVLAAYPVEKHKSLASHVFLSLIS